MLEPIYREKLFNTKLLRTLKKLIKDFCTKNACSFNEIIWKQKDWVLLGLSLGSVLANIIMIELERVIVGPLIASGKFKFCRWYVDDTLLSD